eukprot:1346482-Pleurochrysis_carterae.AAC.1
MQREATQLNKIAASNANYDSVNRDALPEVGTRAALRSLGEILPAWCACLCVRARACVRVRACVCVRACACVC